MNSPRLYHVEDVEEISKNMAQTRDGYWTPARPLGYQGINLRWRLRMAWRVFTGRYDALQWRGQ